MTRRRLLVVFHFIERDAEIAQRLRIVGPQRERAAALLNRLVRQPGEAAHLAEVGMIERDVGGERPRPPQVLDRLSQLAGLMCDQPEQMTRVRLVWLRREDAGAE